ncbi:GerMN domain-containing protein [Cohnella caldifontis]|uniref:GerMN domain-containing protein n=1 Tax=Cohnella caldifontis TaxID=3027471 RepID=UPI0023EBB652|nr:GerMN domain-containing protein [Cohnella sp. YIM B05605]
MNRKLNRIRKARKWAAIALMVPLVSACGAAGSGKGNDAGSAGVVDPPPYQVEETMLQQSEEATVAQESDHPAATENDRQSAQEAPETSAKDAAKTSSASADPADTVISPEDSVTVYLRDANGYLAPMTLRLSPEDSSAKESALAAAETAVSWLTEDPQRKDQLPEGFAAVIPQGVQVESVKLDTEKGTASVDFADKLPGMTADSERKMLEAIVWTLTELPGIDQVKLSVSGKPIRSLPASNTPVDERLTRGIGINVEPAKGVQLSRSMAVTLYFSARAADGNGYFVPVTRLVDRAPDRMKAAVNELIKGPADTASLQNDVLPGITVDELTQSADTVNVSLRDPDWTPDQTLPSEMMDELVLTLTEAAGVPKVKVAMNGDDSFLDSDHQAYDHPVTRPSVVNSLKR